MRKLGCAIAMLILGLCAVLAFAFLRRPSESPAAQRGAAQRDVAQRDAARVIPSSVVSRGRPALSPDADWLGRARNLLGSKGQNLSCGPYALYTDVRETRLLATCGRLAKGLDALYLRRYGVAPVGEPAEAIVLFSKIEDYRAFARESGVALGYAGYAVGARGLAVFHVDASAAETFPSTLTHELTHLVSRRALGVNLPPWLSEGLSDGIGDTATAEGFGPVEGVTGSEVQHGRLKEAYTSGRAGELARLVALKRGEFDRGTVSFDYEQSALLVRFLMSDAELAAGFRRFLSGVANQEGVTPDRLRQALGVEWAELDRRFRNWVRNPSRG